MSTLMGQLQARIEAAVNKTGTYNEALQNLADAFGVPPSETGSRLIPVVKVFDPTIDNATAAQNYLLYNSTVVAGGIPAMALNFTSSESLDSRITFSRASNATVVNSDGLVSYAPHNLLTNSESFEASAWSKLAAGTGVAPVVTANAATAPDGTATADLIVFDRGAGTSGSDISYITFSLVAFTGTAVSSVWLKTSDGSTKQVQLRCGAPAGTRITVTGTWQRFSVTSTNATIDRFQLLLYGNDPNQIASLYVWGAQLNEGPLQPYYFTTPKNLLGYTQEFDNAAWTKAQSSVTANATVAPDGTTTADLWTPTTTGVVDNTRLLASVSQTTNGALYSVSVYVKASGRRWVYLAAPAASSNAHDCWFDLQNGVVGTQGASVTNATIVSVGNGWYRLSTSSIGTSTTNYLLLSAPNADGNSSVTSDGTGIFVWGAQLSNSASVDPYVYNPGAAPTSAAYYGPRFDYDPVSRAPKGLLIEEQRTNLLTYSDGTVANLGANSNVTDASSAISTSFTNSIQFGDNSVSRFAYKPFTTTASVIYTLSVYVRMNDDSQPVVSTTSTAGDFGLVFENNLVTIAPTVTTSGSNVFRITASLTASGGVGLNFGVVKYTTQTAKGFRVTGYQLEAGAFATSYIPTVAAQVTRSADNASMLGDNFANWYNASEGTFFTEYGIFSIAAGILGDGSVPSALMYSSNRDVKTFNGTSDATTSNQTPLNTPAKGALSYATNTRNVVLNAGTLASTTGNLQVVSSLQIGLAFGSNRLNGHIRRVMYYNTRLTNAQLQALTS